MNTNPIIAVVVVTYNRVSLLLKSIEAILKQTRVAERIYIINNASTDTTSEVIGDLVVKYPNIKSRTLASNTGSAGGFHIGVQDAFNEGADWVWLLDDDVAPLPDCLENMLKYEHVSHCIHPNKRDTENTPFIAEAIFDPSTARTTFLGHVSFDNGKEYTYTNIGCFEGMLIHRDIITKIGTPDERFFMISDDMMYGFLASLHTNVIVVKDAMLQKLLPFSSTIQPRFLYYFVRNQFLVKEYLQSQGLYNKSLFMGYLHIFMIYVAIKHTIRNRSLKTIWYIVRGYIDGRRKRFYAIK